MRKEPKPEPKKEALDRRKVRRDLPPPEARKRYPTRDIHPAPPRRGYETR
jgi:hypothetical protein